MLLERESPIETLLTAVQSAAAGRGRTVLLEGEAGIGKTALLYEFAGRVDKDCRVLWGWCEALFTPRPLGPLQDMAQALDPSVAALIDQTAAPERLFPELFRLASPRGTRRMAHHQCWWRATTPGRVNLRLAI